MNSTEEAELLAEFDTKLADMRNYLDGLRRKAENGDFMEGLRYVSAIILIAHAMKTIPPGWRRVDGGGVNEIPSYMPIYEGVHCSTCQGGRTRVRILPESESQITQGVRHGTRDKCSAEAPQYGQV